MDGMMGRRELLSRGARYAVGAAAFGSLLDAGAAFGATRAAVGAAGLGTLRLQLNWIRNFEFAGSYIADKKGYYRKEGFSSVKLMTGGPTVSVEPIVASGKATLAYGVTELTAAAIQKGAPLTIIGAGFQKNPLVIMSLASKPLMSPKDMIGKKIGVQAFEDAVWTAFLKINKIDAGKVTKVPVQFDPAPLVNGDVDGFVSFSTNEPVALAAQGVKTHLLFLGDFGFNLFEQVYVVGTETLKKNRAAVVGALRAEARGWRENIKNPTLGPSLGVNVYGKGLGLKLPAEIAGNKAQIKLMDTPWTRRKGLFYMNPADIAKVVKTLGVLGVKVSSGVFTNDVLDEIYKNGVI